MENKQYLITNLRYLLGCKYSDSYVNHIKDTIPFKIQKGADDSVLIEVYENNEVTRKEPLELLSMIVNHVVDLVKSSKETKESMEIK